MRDCSTREATAERRVALAVAVLMGAVFVLLAALLVPWDPVPGGPLRPVDPGGLLPPAEVERAERFSSEARRWSLCSLTVSTLIACWFGLTRWGRSVTARLRGPWWLRVLQAVLVLLVVGRLLTLPFAVAQRHHFREYGISTQGWPGFAADLVKAELVEVLATTLVLLAVMACARRWRRAWPAVAAAVAAGLVLAGSFVYPLLVEPLYASFTPLPDGELRRDVLRLAEAEGVRVDDVLVSDASRRTTTINAYVSGFGSTRRVVLYDTLVDDLPRDQALSVVAHELSHARHDDVLVGSVLGATGAAAAVGLLGVVLTGPRRRGASVRDPAVVPAVLALLVLASLVAAPVQNGISRRVETRADVDALRYTDDPEAFVGLQRELVSRSLSDLTPPAWYQLWFGSHPTATTRTALAERFLSD